MNHQILLLLAPAIAVALLVAALNARAEIPRQPIPGVNLLPEVVELESRTAALRRWVSRGVKQAVLVYFDTADGMRPIGSAQEAALAEIRRSAPGGGTVSGGPIASRHHTALETRFVAAAVALGIVREAYWIMPYDYFRSPDPAGSLRQDLKEAGFSEADLRSFALRDGCFRGSARGTPFAVCGLESMPRIADPVILNFDADFIISTAAAGSTNPLAEIRKLLAALAVGKYLALDAVVVASVENGPVRPDLRWVGETLISGLRDPAVLSSPDPPKRWTQLQNLDILKNAGNFLEMFHQVLAALTIHADDPALQLYAAEARAGQGKLDEALALAKEACRLHPGYCCGLPWIGLHLFAAGVIDGGERFFAAGTLARPDLVYGQVARGLTLQRAGRVTEALAVFQALSDGGSGFPGGFLAGALLVRLGDRQGAERQFDRALEALQVDPDSEVTDLDTALAVQEAERLYRQAGQIGKADALKNNPRLRLGELEVLPEQP